ncbi:MAG: hypothetical protein IKP50_00265 [Bacilli bacterium]|nr:hypothetical protein [Bacilli bacterium]
MARSKALLNVLNLVNTQELPIEKQFLNDLKASIELQDVKNSRKPSQTYKPSSLHCIRNMEYQRMGVPLLGYRTSNELIGICESGTDRHERLQEACIAMKANNIDCEYINVAEYVKQRKLDYLEVVSQQGNETKLFHKGLNMSFLCDGIIKYKGHYYILEIKTETSSKWWERQGVNPDHILQGTAYSEALKINEVIFLYENRDSCNKKAYLLVVTEPMRERLVDKIHECEEYVANNIIAPKPLDVPKKYCAYCQYSERCKQDG